MGLILASAGLQTNYLELAANANASAITASDVDAELGVDNLYSGDPAERFAYGSGAAGSKIEVDLDLIENGGFETFDVPTTPNGWIVESGTASRDTSNEVEGAACLKTSDLNALVSQTKTLPSNMRINVRAQAKGAAASTASIFVRNLATGNYLTAAGAWTSTPTAFVASSSGSYVSASRDAVDLEGFVASGYRHSIPLKVECKQTAGSEDVYFDAIHIWPSWNLSALVNIEAMAGATVKIEHDSDPAFGSATTAFTFDDVRPSVWDWSGSASTFFDERYIRVIQTEANPEGAASIGEWYVGRVIELTTGQELPRRYTYTTPGGSVPKIGGGRRQLPYSDPPPAIYPLRFYHDETSFREFEREVWLRSRGGSDRSLLIPNKNAALKSNVYLGRFAGALPVTEPAIEKYEYEIDFVEDGYGLSF